MTVTIDASVGGANANSYLTVADADAIANLRLGTLAWEAATVTTDDKARALIAATGYLDQLQWIGDKATTAQALLWPRSGAECGDKVHSSSIIPPEIQDGTFDLANALLTTPTLLTPSPAGFNELIPGIPNANLKRATVDVLTVEFQSPGTGAPAARNALTMMPHLIDLFGCLCLSAPRGSVGLIRTVRS
jgi:hypothetical protein